MTDSLLMWLGLASIFLALFAFLGTIGVLTVERSQVSRSLAAVRSIDTLHPSKAPSSVTFDERVLRPAILRLTKLGKRFTPAGQVERIQKKLDVAGNPARWDPDRIIAFKMLGLFVGVLLGILVPMALHSSVMVRVAAPIGAAVLGYFTPDLTLYQIGAKRTERMRRELPDAMDMLTISVEAGLGFDAALAQVARNTQGPVAEEFFRVLQEMQIGLGRSDALRALGERTNLPELRTFVTAMVQADAFGIPIADVLRVQAHEMRLKRSQRAEEMAQKVPVKILFPLIFCIMPALFIVVIGPASITIVHNFFHK
jgi:tight adherence protein C